MGAFNILVIQIQCKVCQHLLKGNLQFKFGDTWQHQYLIGDKIKWGKNDIGKPGQASRLW
jgi:hypothetical protein